MITFEDIKKANETIVTTDINGKDYAEVNQRIKAFRMVYPNGIIKTEMVRYEDGICIFKADIYNEEEQLIATGTAYEQEGSTFINKTSYIENCETSAVGRALGMAGFGIDTSVASAEEVQNAILNQEQKEEPKKEIKKTTKPKANEIMIQESQIKMINELYSEEEIKPLLAYIKKTKVEELTLLEASSLIKRKENK